MRDELEARLEQLKQEFQLGQGKLQELELQQAQLTETMLRISGAIQALEEVLAADAAREDGTAVREPEPAAK